MAEARRLRMERDPVCGTDVAARTAEHVIVHEGRAFYFCSARCRETFEADPQKYVDPDERASMPGL